MNSKLSYLIELIKKNPNDKEKWLELSNILKLQKKDKKSEIAYKKYLELVDEEITEDEEEDDNNMNNLYNKMKKNDLIQSKLHNPKFQQKIMNNRSNPMALFGDPELMQVMKEMIKEL